MFCMATLETLVEQRLAGDHPLRRIRAKAEEVLRSLSPELDALYSHRGRPSIPPEQIFLALLWMALFSIRSERLLEECLRYDLRCRWFVGLPLEQDSWDHSTFSRARDALLLDRIAALFFERHLDFLRARDLLSSEHLSVDGSLLAAWASHKSLVERADLDENGKPPSPPSGGRNAWVDFKGTKRSNETHVSTTDPEARLASKGMGARLCHEFHVVAENRNNFAVAMTVTPPTGTSEREAAATLIAKECAAGRKPSTVGADRKYAEGDDLVVKLADLDVVPHFAVRDDRPNAFAKIFHDDPGFSVCMLKRMRIEEIFAFTKNICGLAKVKVRGTMKVFGAALVALAAYNLTHEARLSTP